MTQEVLDMVVHAYCDGCQEFIGDYEIIVEGENKLGSYLISIIHPEISKISLPWEFIGKKYTPKAQAEVIIELVKQIFADGDQWLKDEMDYEADKAAKKWDNDRHSDI